MSAYDLPSSLIIGEEAYTIRCGWRAIMDILIAMNDPELDDPGKMTVMLYILYPEAEHIPEAHLEEALQKACDFIDCGLKDDGKPKPRMIDWAQDASLIIPEVNKVARMEVRLDPNIHWWTFFGWFMGIGDGLFANILSLRQKKAKGKKLEKWEKDFYKENRALIDLRTTETEETRAEKDSILKYL